MYIQNVSDKGRNIPNMKIFSPMEIREVSKEDAERLLRIKWFARLEKKEKIILDKEDTIKIKFKKINSKKKSKK